MTLQSEILDGLDVLGWDDSITSVKRVVANALRQLDRGVDIKDTAYFNHSFVPDFVLTWPRDSGRTRDVFLRLDSSNAFLSGDLRYIGDGRPVLFGLTGLAVPVGNDSEDSFVAAAQESPAMITEPSAVEQLGSALTAADFGRVLPAAVLKGGKGLVTAPTAAGLTAAASRFFQGARAHNGETVQQAVPEMTDHLDTTQTLRLVNFGRIVWEATGGQASLFPLPTELSGTDDTGLRFLIEQAPSGDAPFWRSVGRLVSLQRLLSLGVREATNLAAFVRANADRLNARALVVKASQPQLDDAAPSWSVEAGGLALRGSDFIAYMAPSRDDLTVKSDQVDGLSFSKFRERTSQEQVETVTIVAGDGKTVTIESEDMFDPETDLVLASVGDLPGAAVKSVGLIVGGKHLGCDFAERVATGRTNALFDVMSLLERALPMLWPLTDSRDVGEVRSLRENVASVGLLPSLFDEQGPPTTT